MTRQEAKEWLISIGIAEPQPAQVSALLTTISENSKSAIEEAVASAKNDTKLQIEKQFEGYVSKDVHDALVNNYNALKESSEKQVRYSKFKDKGIAEKWYEYADTKLDKNSKEYDKLLDDFVKENPEVIAKVDKQVVIGNVSQQTNQDVNPNAHAFMNDKIREVLNK